MKLGECDENFCRALIGDSVGLTCGLILLITCRIFNGFQKVVMLKSLIASIPGSGLEVMGSPIPPVRLTALAHSGRKFNTDEMILAMIIVVLTFSSSAQGQLNLAKHI